MQNPIQGLASLVTPGLTVLSGNGSPKVAVPAVKATGLITVPVAGGAAIIAGQTFTLKDGTHTVVFEFVADALDIADPGNIPVVFDGTETAPELAAIIETAVNGVGAGLTLTGTAPGDRTVSLLNDATGTAGNQTQSETVVDTGFVLSNMAGGAAISGLNPAQPAVYFQDNGTVWSKTGATDQDWTSL